MNTPSSARAFVSGLSPNKRFALALTAIAFAGFAIRIAYTLTLAADLPFGGDPRSYHLLGINLADGLGYIRPPQLSTPGFAPVPTAEFPPLFPALLAVATWLGARSVTAQELLMCGLGTFTIILLGVAGRRLAGNRVGYLAAAIAAVHPLIFQPDGILMSESLYLLLISGVLLAAIRATEQPTRWWRWALVGVLMGLAALTRTESLLLLPLLGLPIALRRGDRGTAIRACLVTAAATVLVVVPWTVRNAVEFGRLVPVSTNTGTVILGANCPDTYRGKNIGSWSYACIVAFANTQGRDANIVAGGRNEAEVYDSWRRQGFHYATEHAGRLSVVTAVRVLRTWGLWKPSDDIDFDAFEGRDRTVQTIGYWLALALLPFAVIGARVLWRTRGRRVTWILVAPAVVATIVAMTGFGSTRIRAIAEPGLAVLSAVGVTRVVTRGGPSNKTAALPVSAPTRTGRSDASRGGR